MTQEMIEPHSFQAFAVPKGFVEQVAWTLLLQYVEDLDEVPHFTGQQKTYLLFTSSKFWYSRLVKILGAERSELEIERFAVASASKIANAKVGDELDAWDVEFDEEDLADFAYTKQTLDDIVNTNPGMTAFIKEISKGQYQFFQLDQLDGMAE